jgi:hypothetical protein
MCGIIGHPFQGAPGKLFIPFPQVKNLFSALKG